MDETLGRIGTVVAADRREAVDAHGSAISAGGVTMKARLGARWSIRGAAALLAGMAFFVDFEGLVSVPSVPSAEAQYGTSRRVARRTARRTSRRQVAYAGGGYGGAYYGAPGYVAAPPSNCMVTGAFWECGGLRYQQAMQNDQVVYVPVQ